MISFFTIAKRFAGHIGIIQRNALQSWARLLPGVEVILIGDDGGSAEVASEFRLGHVPRVARNEYGTPLVNDLFAIAEARSRHDLLCYINADIVLMSDFAEAARRVRELRRPFLMCGRRWKLDVTEPIRFDGDWEERLRAHVRESGKVDDPSCVDYFLFTRGVFGAIPPFAIGRRRWDRWLQARARSRVGLFIDATEAVTAVHQNHDYGKVGFAQRKRGPESRRNIELAGGQFCDLREATHKLTARGVSRALDMMRLRWQVHKVTRACLHQLRRVEARTSTALTRAGCGGIVKASHSLRRFAKTGHFARRHRVAVIGLGKIGLPLAVCLAERHCTVSAIDADASKREAIQAGHAPFYEQGLDALLGRCRDRLAIGHDIEKAVCLTDTTLLVLPTNPVGSDDFTSRELVSACEAVGRALAHRDTYHLVVVVSAVLPGWTGGTIRAALEHASGKPIGPSIGLCYWPAFVALGNTIDGFLTPEFVLIGESDPTAGSRLESLLRYLVTNHAPIVRTSFINAELARLALNTYVPMRISFANAMAQMCERFQGADVDVISSVLQRDSRVGRGYLTGGPSYGGPSFPSDLRAIASVARQLGVSSHLAEATQCVNDEIRNQVLRLVRQTTRAGQRVGICGISFKRGTSCLDGSLGLWLAQRLRQDGYSIVLYDPEPTPRDLPDRQEHVFAESLDECIRRSATVVFLVPHPKFVRIKPERLQAGGTRRSVIDCWRVLDASCTAAVADYHALGLGPWAAEHSDDRLPVAR